MNSFMITALAAIFVFGLLITTHELGHFIVAKLSGVTVLEFAIGMGPKIFSFKKGETKYTLRLLPIGGYNKMLGEQEKSDDPKAFSNKSPWKRLGIIISGALMNFLIAIVLFFLYSYNIGIIKPVISHVEKNYPASSAGIQIKDEILKINDAKIKNWDDFTYLISVNKNKPINLLIKRNGTTFPVTLTPLFNKSEGRYMLGIQGTNVKGEFFDSLKKGFFMMTDSVGMMLDFLNKAIHRQVSSNEVGGPVAIVKLSGQFAMKGIWFLLYFTAFLSVNLGVMNLIPFPALDGGWVIILLYEGITRRKIDENKIGFVNLIGFAILIGFIILVTLKDIFHPSTF